MSLAIVSAIVASATSLICFLSHYCEVSEEVQPEKKLFTKDIVDGII